MTPKIQKGKREKGKGKQAFKPLGGVMRSTSSLSGLTNPKREKGTLQTLQCHERVPSTPVTHQAEPGARHGLKHLQDACQTQHPDGWASIRTRNTGIIPAHSEALCRPPSSVEMPGSGQHAMSCLTGQHRRGPIGKAATTGQAGWMVPLGVTGSLQPQHLVTDGNRFAAAHRRIQVEWDPFGS
jgi:hypothetical protein